MAAKRTHGVVTQLEPLTITANRRSYQADATSGLALGTVVTFAPGERATSIKLVKADPKRKQSYPARLSGIAVAEASGGMSIRALPGLGSYFREADDDDLQVGDQLTFEVMSDDRLAWNLTLSRAASSHRAHVVHALDR